MKAPRDKRLQKDEAKRNRQRDYFNSSSSSMARPEGWLHLPRGLLHIYTCSVVTVLDKHRDTLTSRVRFVTLAHIMYVVYNDRGGSWHTEARREKKGQATSAHGPTACRDFSIFITTVPSTIINSLSRLCTVLCNHDTRTQGIPRIPTEEQSSDSSWLHGEIKKSISVIGLCVHSKTPRALDRAQTAEPEQQGSKTPMNYIVRICTLYMTSQSALSLSIQYHHHTLYSLLPLLDAACLYHVYT